MWCIWNLQILQSESYPVLMTMHKILDCWIEFDVRLQDFKLCEVIFAIIIVPFNLETEKEHDLQMDLI
jgi:hypothetical protein